MRMSDAQSVALTADSAGQRLGELPEAHASGELGRIYGEIKRLSAVPMVALIYRHLATIPGALEWAWGLIGPAMQAGLLQQRAWQLGADALIPTQRAIPRAALRAAGIGAADETAITAVLDAYNRANPVNIMAVRCLALHLAGNQKGECQASAVPAWHPPAALAALPAMVDPRAMDPTVRELVILLTSRSEAASASPLWPSLYRHLAHWPALLGYASVVVVPEFAAIDAAATRLREQVGQAAAELAPRMVATRNLAPPADAHRERLLQAIEQFSLRIPEMVVIGGLLRRAMPRNTGHVNERGVN
jgi:hypothetical protein